MQIAVCTQGEGAEVSVVRRSKEQKAHSGERLNMDNQQLTACPRLVEEEKLRLLNYQSNSIRQIQNLDGTTNRPHLLAPARRVGAGIRLAEGAQ